MGNKKLVKNGAGCRCGSKSGGYSCGPKCNNKKGGRFGCGNGADALCGPSDHTSAKGDDFLKKRSVKKGNGRTLRRKKSNRIKRNKTKKRRRKRLNRKGGVYHNSQNSQNSGNSKNAQLAQLGQNANAFGIRIPHTLVAVGEAEKDAINMLSPLMATAGDIIGYIDQKIGDSIGTQLEIDCNKRDYELYKNVLLIFLHHVMQILLLPHVSNLAQQFLTSSSSFVVHILHMIQEFFGQQIAPTNDISNNLKLIVGWMWLNVKTLLELGKNVADGGPLFSNLIISIMTFLGTTTKNMTTTTVIPLGVFIYILFNMLVYSYMGALNRIDLLKVHMIPIIEQLGIQIHNFENMTVDDLKDHIQNSLWKYIINNSPVKIVLRKEILDEHIVGICHSLLRYDYIQGLLQTAFGNRHRTRRPIRKSSSIREPPYARSKSTLSKRVKGK